MKNIRRYWPFILIILLCIPGIYAAKKITELTALTPPIASGDLLVVIDVSDTTMAATGTNKKITAQNFFAYARQGLTKTQANSPYTIGSTFSGNARESYGAIFDNQGATAAVTFYLPDGEQYSVLTFVVDDAYDIDLQPSENGACTASDTPWDCCTGASAGTCTSNQIITLTDNAGDKLSSDATQGSMITLYKISTTEWMPMGYVGTWSDAN